MATVRPAAIKAGNGAPVINPDACKAYASETSLGYCQTQQIARVMKKTAGQGTLPERKRSQAASAVDAANKIVPVCRGYLRALSALRNRPGASGAVFHASKADQGAKIAFARGRFFTPARFGEEGRNGKAQSAKTENTSIAFAPGCTGDSPAANAKYAKYPACFAAGFSRFGKSLLNHQKTLDSLERIWYSLLG